jgi:myo-inositol-1(or 4)-monophosphatase
MADYSNERRVAESLARTAGERMTRERREGFSVELKAENDPVTDIDRSIEEFLVAELGDHFPDDTVIGEEFGADRARKGRTWYVDPIDGTLNFSRGLPMYCVSIGFQVDAESRAAAIYDPARDELFSAAHGEGAQRNGSEMQVSDVDGIEDALLVTGFPRSLDDAEVDNIVNFARLTRASQGVRRLGSAALDLAYVAAGRLDGFWEYYLNPWDTAAGYLLVREAGGEVSDVHGDAFGAHEPSLLATNGSLHDEIIERLEEL